MSVEALRQNMLNSFQQSRPPDLFLSSFFVVREGNISDTELVTVDIVREDEEISPVVNICEGGSWNQLTGYTNKEWRPPSIKEKMPFNCQELFTRLPGVNAFDAANMDFQAQLMVRMIAGVNQLSGKVARNRESQAEQILQAGTLSLLGEDGSTFYSVDYKPKATHFPTSALTWNDVSADVLGDLRSLSSVIRTDGLSHPDVCIMGEAAFAGFIKNTQVLNFFDNRRYEIGNIVPEGPSNFGATRQGQVSVGPNKLEIWTYDGQAIKPGAGTKTKYLATGSCIILSSDARLDTVFGGVPTPMNVNPEFVRMGMPERISVPGAVDLQPHIFTNEDGSNTTLQVTSRPLLIPTAIDSFGNLDTQAS